MKKKYQHTAFDNLLIVQCQQRDEKAFNLLVNRWHERLLRHAIRTVRDVNSAKDIVQNAWISISKNIRSLKNPVHFGPWALRIVYHKSIDHLRKQKKTVKEWQPQQKDTEYEKKLETILAKLNELPEKHRLILSMFYLEEMPVAEIAYILSIPPGTVKSRLFSARKYFKKHLKNMKL